MTTVDVSHARGVVTDGAGGFEVSPFDLGGPGPGEVLVAIAASGVCHTDHDTAVTSPAGVILGHEGAGEVLETGRGVDDLRAGDRVVLTWAISCGECFPCTQGSKVLCERLGPGPGGHAHEAATTRGGVPLRRSFNLGTLATHTVVRREAVVPIGDEIPLTAACLLGCGVMTGYGSVVNVARVPAGASVVVLGCGGVGLAVVQAARISGAGPIVAVDLNPRRLEVARRLGATHDVVADPMLVQANAQARAIVGARGADFAFECTGVPVLAAAPLAFVRHGGTAVQVSGTEQEITVDMRLFEWDKVYVNPLYGGCDPAVDLPRLVHLYGRGELVLDELVTTYALDDAGAAFEGMLRGRDTKAVVLP